jgi:hypothetical protein
MHVYLGQKSKRSRKQLQQLALLLLQTEICHLLIGTARLVNVLELLD